MGYVPKYRDPLQGTCAGFNSQVLHQDWRTMKQSNGDITLEMLQRAYARTLKPLETKKITFFCKPNEVSQVKALIKKIFGK